jgi:hypothetical protein
MVSDYGGQWLLFIYSQGRIECDLHVFTLGEGGYSSNRGAFFYTVISSSNYADIGLDGL